MGVEVHDHHPGMVSHLALCASFKEMVVGSIKKGVLDIQENDEDDVQLLKEDFTESCYKPSERGCSDEDIGTSTSNAQPQVQGEKRDVAEKYGPWMLVDQCPRKSDQKTRNGGEETTSFKRSRFNALTTLRDNDSAENHVLKLVNSTNLKGKGLAVYGNPLGGEDSNVECELLHVNGLDRLGQTNEPSKKTQHRGSLSKIVRGPMISPGQVKDLGQNIQAPFVSSDKEFFPQTVVQDLSTAINPSRLIEKKADGSILLMEKQ
ncbi:hypothetical protein GOBAR_DD07688 [Gossypium barbadense]|nr:hypothetical protein GOBAR_DD07688 [Gossypium barbadense]